MLHLQKAADRLPSGPRAFRRKGPLREEKPMRTIENRTEDTVLNALNA